MKVCRRLCYPAGETFSGCEAHPLRCLGILYIIEVSTTEFIQVMSCVHILLQRCGPVSYKGHPHQTVCLKDTKSHHKVHGYMCFLKEGDIECGCLPPQPKNTNKHMTRLTLNGTDTKRTVPLVVIHLDV